MIIENILSRQDENLSSGLVFCVLEKASNFKKRIYEHKKDFKQLRWVRLFSLQSQFLSKVKLVWIQGFLSARLFAVPRLKDQVCPTIYPSMDLRRSTKVKRKRFRLEFEPGFRVHFWRSSNK